MEQAPTPPRPWYREPWPWLLMAGPATVIVAGLFTAVLAFTSEDGLVADDYYKQGLAINRVLERSRRAQALHISAVVEVSGTRVNARVSGADLSSTLRFRMIHPTRAAADRDANLVARGGGLYAGELAGTAVPADAERRYWVLEDANGGWRITGTTSARVDAAR